MSTRAVPWGPVPAAEPHPAVDSRSGVRQLPYHRLGHTDPEHRWWKPLVELLVLVSFYLLLTVVFGALWAFAVVALRGEQALDDLVLDPDRLDLMDPALLFMALGSLVLMIPAVLLARAVMGPRPVGLLLSVTGRLRWRFLAHTTLLALAVYVLGQGLLILLEGTVLGTLPPARLVEQFPLVMLMVVLLVPLQSAAEELVFRGYMMQTVGRWLRRPLLAILLPVPLFTLAHFYGVWGQLSVATMAVVAGYLTWRTGGLEAAIGLHVVNNVLAFSIEAVGWTDPQAEETTWGGWLVTAGLQILFAWLVVRAARRRGIEVTRTVAPPVPWPLPHGSVPPVGTSAPAGWVCPGPPACPGQWAPRPSAPQRLP